MVGVAVSKVAMLTHCQALTQACNYCEGEWRLDISASEGVFLKTLFSFY